MRSALPAPWTSMYQSVRAHARSGAGRGVCAFTELRVGRGRWDLPRPL